MNGEKLFGDKLLVISIPSTGGLAHYANDLCNALSFRFRKVILLTLGAFEIPSRFWRYRLEVVADQRFRNKFERGYQLLKVLVRALRLTYREHPTLVFINGYEPLVAWWYCVLRPAEIPVFCIQHEVEPRLGNDTIGWFQRDFYRRVTGTIVHKNTDGLELLTHKYGVKNPVIQIDQGLYDSDIFGRDRYEGDVHEGTILSFGTARPDKGTDVLVQAYPGAAACAGLKLQIAGWATPDYARKLSLLIAQHDHKADIKWARGYVSLESIAKYYCEAAFVALPFVAGRQSATLRLALFFGKPVIVTNTGELPHLVRKYGLGLVVPPNDETALRAALVELSNDVLLRQEIATRVRALQESPDLDWTTIVNDLLEQIGIGA